MLCNSSSVLSTTNQVCRKQYHYKLISQLPRENWKHDFIIWYTLWIVYELWRHFRKYSLKFDTFNKTFLQAEVTGHHKAWFSGPSVFIDLLSTFKNINALNPLKHKFQKCFMLNLSKLFWSSQSNNPLTTNVPYHIETRANQLTRSYMIGKMGW